VAPRWRCSQRRRGERRRTCRTSTSRAGGTRSRRSTASGRARQRGSCMPRARVTARTATANWRRRSCAGSQPRSPPWPCAAGSSRTHILLAPLPFRAAPRRKGVAKFFLSRL
jgi:hypothetical protein